MKILFASSEIYPYAKSGGLADVADALVHSLKSDVDISRVMPFYGFMKEKDFKKHDNFTINLGKVNYDIEIFTKITHRVITYFIKAPLLSDTQNLYGDADCDYENNDMRFGIFCKAIIELSIRLQIEILHLNDWQTALVPLFVKESNLKIKTIFTIHNLSYQGIFNINSLDRLSIDKKHYHIDCLEFHNRVNFLKAAIAYSDSITTVSPTYAKEILTQEFGCGLDGFLTLHKDKLSGILNGINGTVFNPSIDETLYLTYSKKTIENKHKNKINFIKKSTLKDPRKPLFVMITRLVEQKGIDLVIDSMKDLLSNRVNLFIVGDGSSEICERLNNLSKKYDNFEFCQGYNESISHQTYASADFLLMPSKFEPCGLNQFIAMSYGTIPIVHEVGGLKDSVHENKSICGEGIVFNKYTKEEFLLTVQRALTLKKDSKKFKSIKELNMECDFSFKSSALKYLNLYKSLL